MTDTTDTTEKQVDGMITTIRGYAIDSHSLIPQERVSILRIDPLSRIGKYTINASVDVEILQMLDRGFSFPRDIMRMRLSASVDQVLPDRIVASHPITLVRNDNTFTGQMKSVIDVTGINKFAVIELALSSLDVVWRDVDMTLLVNHASLTLSSSQDI